MCRTAILVLALVALTACGAYAAQDSAAAKVHRKTTAAVGAHAARRATADRSRQQAVAAETPTNHPASSTRKATPGEAGRTAGLAIRRRLAQKRTARRLVALHSEHARVASRLQGTHSLHSQNETRETPALEVASTAPVLLLPKLAEATERPRADKALAAKDEAAGAGMNRMASPESQAQGEGAETPGVDTETEDASLLVPRGAMPGPLRGSHESLERQNARVDADGLERIEDETDLADRIAHKLLVPIPASSALAVNAGLPATHRYCRPWTARFLSDLARAHYAQFHRPLEVSSAVRTVEYQRRLMERNGNAAPAEGDLVSPHLTGATIDIAKKGLSRDQIAWMRRRLLALETAGKIDVEEEFQQACFHITVYKSYAPPRTPRPATQAKSGAAGSRRHKAPDPSGTTATQGL